MLDWQLGISPIQAERPQGSSPRDGESFAALEAEIDKLIDLHGQSGPDWKLVSEQASVILRDQGKDLNVAVWLTLGWLHCKGASGLAAGVRVLRDLHQEYWDTMTPAVTRLRGRRNQIEWLIEHLEKVLGNVEPGWSDLEQSQHNELLADWDVLDGLWQEYDEQAPALFKLRRVLADIGYVGEDSPNEDVGAASAGTADVNVTQLEPGAQAHQDKESGVSGADATSGPTAPPAQTPSPAVASGAPVSAAVQTPFVTAESLEGAVLDSAAAVERHIDQGLDAIQAGLQTLPDELLLAPMLFRFNRMCAWMTLDTLPPATEGETRVPAPAPADQDALQRLLDANDALSILRFVESRLPLHRFWLDLNRVACQAAQSLPEGQGAAEVIAFESRCLIQRLPGVHELSFINGQPFADADTQAWLSSLDVVTPAPVVSVAPVVSATHNGSAAVSADALSMATLLAVAGAETQAALRLLNVVASRLQAGSDQFTQR